jgi:hypothetical protein
VSEIDTAMVDSLKVLDPNRPIREAEVSYPTATQQERTRWLRPPSPLIARPSPRRLSPDRDGTMLGGTEFFYFVGTYTCSNGKWKGEFTNEEHSPAPVMRPMAGKGSSVSDLAVPIPTRMPNLTSRHCRQTKPPILGDNAVAGGGLIGEHERY